MEYTLSQRLCNGIFVPGHRTNNLQVARDCSRMGSNNTMILNSSLKNIIRSKATHFTVRLASSSNFPPYSDRLSRISSNHPITSKEKRKVTNSLGRLYTVTSTRLLNGPTNTSIVSVQEVRHLNCNRLAKCTANLQICPGTDSVGRLKFNRKNFSKVKPLREVMLANLLYTH